MDRAPRWQIQVGFFLLDDEPLSLGGIRIEELDDVWPRVARAPLDEVDWRYRVERADWAAHHAPDDPFSQLGGRSEEHTSELQSLMRLSYAVFRLKTKQV